jgi:pre-mRNA-splicing factor SYF1
MEDSSPESLSGLFPLTWPIPTPLTHSDLLTPANLHREEDLLRNASSFRHWWTAINTAKDALSTQQKEAIAPQTEAVQLLGPLANPVSRLALQNLTYMYESALVHFPASFKLWKSYLTVRCEFVMGKSIKPKRAGGRKKLAEVIEALEDELDEVEKWEGGLNGVVGWEEWRALVATFERALIWLPTVRRSGRVLLFSY